MARLFEELSQKFDILQRRVEYTQRFLTKLQALGQETYQLLKRVEAEMDRIGQLGERNVNVRDKDMTEFYFRAQEIALDELHNAVEIAPEYSYKPYWEALFSIFQNKGLYEFVGIHTVRLRMENVAGNLYDWAAAVEEARQAAGYTKEGQGYYSAKARRDVFVHKSPQRRSEGWAKYIYHQGSRKYWQVISTRLAQTLRPAPFWELLDKGNVGTKMNSNLGEGSFPTPTNPATHFVDKIEARLSDVWSNTDKDITYDVNRDWERLHERKRQIEALLTDINFLMGEVRKKIGEGIEVPLPPKIEKDLQILINHYNLIKVKKDTLIQVLQEFERDRVVLPQIQTRQLTLGYTAEGKRVHGIRETTIIRRLLNEESWWK